MEPDEGSVTGRIFVHERFIRSVNKTFSEAGIKCSIFEEHTAVYDDPEALLDVRGGGVLLVDDDMQRAQGLQGPLRDLYVDVDTVASLEEAASRLEGDTPPRVVIVRESVGQESSELWCQRVRSDVQLTESSILLLLERSSDRGMWADDYLRTPVEAEELKHSVRGMLRSYAVRRNISRRERRRAIRWLAGVISHELNNPLAAALANIEDVLEHLTDHAGRPDVDTEAEPKSASKDGWLDEAVELTRDAIQYLDRIREAERRLRDPRTLPRGDAERLTTDQMVDRLRTELSFLGDAPRFVVRDDSRADAVVDPVLLCATTAAVVEAVVVSGGAELTVTLAFDGGRVAVLLEFNDVPSFDPETLLTPRLVAGGSGPLAYDPGLSSVESSFGEAGGQVFATPVPQGWRFGLTLPNLDE